MADRTGSPAVLTADRTLMANHRLLFDGMLAASQTTTAPAWLTGWLVMPWMPAPSFRSSSSARPGNWPIQRSVGR